MNQKMKKRIQEFTFVLPAIIMFLVFVIVPFIQGFPMSFTKWDGMSPNKPFVGFSNYLRIFQDQCYKKYTDLYGSYHDLFQFVWTAVCVDDL